MFSLQSKSISKSLSAKEFSSTFGSLWGKLSHAFFKFERLQSYQEPDNPSYRAFRNGERELAHREMVNERAKDSQRYTDSCQKGITLVRVRAVELPLSEYLRWEFDTYKISAKYGERILVADITNDANDSMFKQSFDFNMFDESAVLVPNYDSTGLLNGGLFIDEPKRVEFFCNLARELVGRSEPLAVFERREGLE